MAITKLTSELVGYETPAYLKIKGLYVLNIGGGQYRIAIDMDIYSDNTKQFLLKHLDINAVVGIEFSTIPGAYDYLKSTDYSDWSDC